MRRLLKGQGRAPRVMITDKRKFRPSDLVPASFIAERITHIDDETCILLSRAGAIASCPACGRMSTRFEAAIATRSRTCPCREGASGFSCARGGSPVMRCSAAGRYSPSGSAMCYLPTPDEPGVSSISSAIWPSRLGDARAPFCAPFKPTSRSNSAQVVRLCQCHRCSGSLISSESAFAIYCHAMCIHTSSPDPHTLGGRAISASLGRGERRVAGRKLCYPPRVRQRGNAYDRSTRLHLRGMGQPLEALLARGSRTQ